MNDYSCTKCIKNGHQKENACGYIPLEETRKPKHENLVLYPFDLYPPNYGLNTCLYWYLREYWHFRDIYNMLKNTEDINHPERWGRNLMAARYGKSLYVARIYPKNIKNSNFFTKILEKVIVEINDGKQNYEISFYEDNYINCLPTLIRAKNKIRTKNAPIKLGNKKIAYGYLDTISSWLDLDKLKKDLLIIHPFLVVIQYRLKKINYTWIGSNNININLIFNIKNNSKSSHNFTIKGSPAKIIEYLKKQIKILSE
jgi:hypothetical protein